MTQKIYEIKPSKFPGNLEEISDPPPKLFVLGELPSSDNTFLCVVGSRKHTNYGRDVVERIIRGLSGYPIVIVSGLAIGIDSIAHKVALDAGLTTIAIPGSGLSPEVLYPRSNIGLARKILEHGGALVSPFESDFKATQWSFPARNRIMAGMSKAVLVIEAEEKSGTLITARLALDYNRDVFAVPGSIFSLTSRGTNALIAQGATPVTQSSDLLTGLGFKLRDSLEKSTAAPTNLSAEEQILWEVLSEPRTRDELMLALSLPTARANELISLMEISGAIKESGGKFHRG